MRVRVAGLLVCLGGAVTAMGQGGTTATLQFSLDRAGPPATQYTLTVAQSGDGLFVPHVVPTLGATEAAQPDETLQHIQVSAPVVKSLFAAVPMVEGGRCETHNKNIAQTGSKVLRYKGNSRDASCSYNYSDDDRVNDATSTFEGIAETLRFGERLRAKLRFDRLGLDTELDGLQTAVAEHRALELENIAPILKTIAANDRVMDRVRRRAELLLQGVTPAQSATGDASSAR